MHTYFGTGTRASERIETIRGRETLRKYNAYGENASLLSASLLIAYSIFVIRLLRTLSLVPFPSFFVSFFRFYGIRVVRSVCLNASGPIEVETCLRLFAMIFLFPYFFLLSDVFLFLHLIFLRFPFISCHCKICFNEITAGRNLPSLSF